MRSFIQGLSILLVAIVVVAIVGEAPAANVQKGVPQKAGGNGGGRGGGNDGGDDTGPWSVSVMFGDAAGDRILSDGTLYADGAQGVDATIRSGGDLVVELGGKNADRGVLYDFSTQIRVGQCVADGNCNCYGPVELGNPPIGGDPGGWFRVNMLNVEPGMHALAVGASASAYYTSDIPGLGTHKKNSSCTVRSTVRKDGNPSDAMVRVTRVALGEWLVESITPHAVNYADDPISTAIDNGDFEMPFSLTIKCLDAEACPGEPSS